MITFVFGVLLFLCALLFIGIALAYKNKDSDLAAGWGLGSLVVGVLAVVLVFFSCLQQVGTKEVGVETAFGSIEGHLGSGLHFAAPWVNVTEMDAAIQTDSYTHRDNLGCVDIRVANQQTACVDVSIRWRIRPLAADELFQNYHTFDNVRDSLVKRELVTALNQQFAGYNPLNSIQYGVPAQGVPPNPTYSELGARVQAQMRSEVDPLNW